MTDHFKVSSVGVAPEDHATDVMLAVLNHLVADFIHDNFSICITDVSAVVPHVEIQLSIGTEDNGMC